MQQQAHAHRAAKKECAASAAGDLRGICASAHLRGRLVALSGAGHAGGMVAGAALLLSRGVVGSLTLAACDALVDIAAIADMPTELAHVCRHCS